MAESFKQRAPDADSYRQGLEELEKTIENRIGKAQSSYNLALQSVAYASKSSLERVFDWKGKAADEYRRKTYEYSDILYGAKEDAAKLRVSLDKYASVAGPKLVRFALSKFSKSKEEDFVAWAVRNKDNDISMLGKALRDAADSSAALQEKMAKMEALEKDLKIDTALSVAVAIAGVIPTGGIASKAAEKFAGSLMGKCVAGGGAKKAAVFAGGFVLDNLFADLSGVALTGADAKETMEKALPGYILGIGMIGGTKALASLLSRNKVSALIGEETKEGAAQLVPKKTAGADMLDLVKDERGAVALGKMEFRKAVPAESVTDAAAVLEENLPVMAKGLRKRVKDEYRNAPKGDDVDKEMKNLVDVAKYQYALAIRELPAAAKAINKGEDYLRQGKTGWECLAYAHYEQAKEFLLKAGFEKRTAETLSLMVVSSETKRYTLPGHQLRAGTVANFLARRAGHDEYFSIGHDIGKVFLPEMALMMGKDSPLHKFNKGAKIAIAYGHSMLPESIFPSMKKLGLLTEKEWEAYGKNRHLFDYGFDHHSYTAYGIPLEIKAINQFADVLDAAFSIRHYEMNKNVTPVSIVEKARRFKSDVELSKVLGESGSTMREMIAGLDEFVNAAYGKEADALFGNAGARERYVQETMHIMDANFGIRGLGSYFKHIVDAYQLAGKEDPEVLTLIKYMMLNLAHETRGRLESHALYRAGYQ